MKKILSKKFNIITIIGLAIVLLVSSYLLVTERSKPSLKHSLAVAHSNHEIRDILYDFYHIRNSNTIMLDNSYQLLSTKWVYNQVPHSFRGFLATQGMSKWTPEISDCDDFSKALTVHLKSIIRNKFPNAKSPAVGEVYYIKDVNSPHAINILVCLQPTIGPVVLFFEPQTQKFVELTENEIKSIFFISI